MTDILIADYHNPLHRKAVIDLLDDYARDPMGGGEPLSAQTRETLIPALIAQPGAFSILAFDGDKPVGLVNCFQTLSTFKARPLINIHDVAVKESHRGKGISTRMLHKVEEVARQRDCCKLTLEVLDGNTIAQNAYRKLGFSGYELNPQLGKALFWEKKLPA
ncbi:MAG TPA: GNAT family N-acetyltransferase [Chromatiaceae bacterium]|nr:GNAT family N-acetyltransferase [Chromatiaceae bacterium]